MSDEITITVSRSDMDMELNGFGKREINQSMMLAHQRIKWIVEHNSQDSQAAAEAGIGNKPENKRK